MRIYLAVMIIIFLNNIAISQKDDLNLLPQKRVTIDCTKIEDTLIIKTEKIFDIRRATGKNDVKKYRMMEFELMNDSIAYFLDYSQGGGPCLYKVNLKSSEFSQFGEPGMGPGEFLNIISINSVPDKFFYVVDNYAKRVQKFDSKGNFINSAFVPDFQKDYFSIAKNYNYISKPKDMEDLYLVSIYDSVGKEIKKLAPVTGKISEFFSESGTCGYSIVSSEKSNFIWIVSKFEPIIRKYDYDGNFLCEYKLLVNANKEQPKPMVRPGIKMTLFTSPVSDFQIIDNETIVCNLNNCGLILLNLGTVENEENPVKIMKLTTEDREFWKIIKKFNGKYLFISLFSVLKEL